MNDPSIQIDFFALIIILGVIQGIFLSFFFLNKRIRRNPSNLYLGFVMLSLSLIILEIFLNYTGYMFKVLRIDNFSEPISFAVSPLMYFYIFSSITGKLPKRVWLQMTPMIFWFLYSMIYYTYPMDLRYAHYMSYHFPDLNIQVPPEAYSEDPWHLRKYINELVMIHLTIYLIASLFVIARSFKMLQKPFFANKIIPLSWLRTFVFLMFLVLLSVVIVKTVFIADVGDYIIGSLISIVIYTTSFNIIKTSDFFQDKITDPLQTNKKYVKSALQDDEKEIILLKLKSSMEEDKDFKNNLVSLPFLAKKLGAPVHHISQVINEKLHQSFFEMIASYRIDEARNILSDNSKDNITIEEIADDVGYNSKSAFNRSFKKHTGKTPSEYRSSQ
jgi:AraC-like DNA-binding protein